MTFNDDEHDEYITQRNAALREEQEQDEAQRNEVPEDVGELTPRIMVFAIICCLPLLALFIGLKFGADALTDFANLTMLVIGVLPSAFVLLFLGWIIFKVVQKSRGQLK